MNFEVILSRRAERYLARQDPKTQSRLVRGLRLLADDPFNSGAKPLEDIVGRWSLRVGTMRILFAIDQPHRTVHVSAIGPRGDVYRNL